MQGGTALHNLKCAQLRTRGGVCLAGVFVSVGVMEDYKLKQRNLRASLFYESISAAGDVLDFIIMKRY
jgi:hypothetical protein